jgi:hypothetical protein
MCAWKQDLLPVDGAWNRAVTSEGRGLGVLSCVLFFPFLLWLVVSLVAVSERALLIAGNGLHG